MAKASMHAILCAITHISSLLATTQGRVAPATHHAEVRDTRSTPSSGAEPSPVQGISGLSQVLWDRSQVPWVLSATPPPHRAGSPAAASLPPPALADRLRDSPSRPALRPVRARAASQAARVSAMSAWTRCIRSVCGKPSRGATADAEVASATGCSCASSRAPACRRSRPSWALVVR